MSWRGAAVLVILIILIATVPVAMADGVATIGQGFGRFFAELGHRLAGS